VLDTAKAAAFGEMKIFGDLKLFEPKDNVPVYSGV
jgi:hypothetical protein